MSPRKIYVASSWRNMMQPGVVMALRKAGHEVYDFKNPEPNTGFSWKEVMENYDESNDTCDSDEYFAALDHPRSIEGFDSDFTAMQWADTCLLVLPCGRSAHLEAGWFAADPDRELAILLDGDANDGMVTPELMYRVADVILPSFFDMLGWAGVQDELGYDGWRRDGS